MVYSFRGAENGWLARVERILKPETPLQLCLSTNFRSSHSILAAAGSLIANNVENSDVRQAMRPCSSKASQDCPPVLLLSAHSVQTAARAVADCIAFLVDKLGPEVRSQIAVLAKSIKPHGRTIAAEIQQQLASRAVPFELANKASPDTLSLLDAAVSFMQLSRERWHCASSVNELVERFNPLQEHAGAAHAGAGGATETVFNMKAVLSKLNARLDEMAREEDAQPFDFFTSQAYANFTADLLAMGPHYGFLTDLFVALRRLREAAATMLAVTKDAPFDAVGEWLNNLLEVLELYVWGVLRGRTQDASGDDSAASAHAAQLKFAREIPDFQLRQSVVDVDGVSVTSLRQQDLTPGQVLELVLEMLREEIMMFVAPGNRASDGSVAVATVHSAKGLEWPIVFAVDMQKGSLPQDTSEPQMLEEDRRLAHVAMTRAMNLLVVVSAHDSGEPVFPNELKVAASSANAAAVNAAAGASRAAAAKQSWLKEVAAESETIASNELREEIAKHVPFLRQGMRPPARREAGASAAATAASAAQVSAASAVSAAFAATAAPQARSLGMAVTRTSCASITMASSSSFDLDDDASAAGEGEDPVPGQKRRRGQYGDGVCDESRDCSKRAKHLS